MQFSWALYYVEDTLWTGIPVGYTNPNAPEALSEVRKLVDDGKYAEATAEAVKLSGNPSDVLSFLNFTVDSRACWYDAIVKKRRMHVLFEGSEIIWEGFVRI